MIAMGGGGGRMQTHPPNRTLPQHLPTTKGKLCSSWLKLGCLTKRNGEGGRLTACGSRYVYVIEEVAHKLELDLHKM